MTSQVFEAAFTDITKEVLSFNSANSESLGSAQLNQ